MRRRLVPALLAFAALGAVTSCSSGAPSSSSGPLTVYSGRNAKLVDPILDMFEESSGIEVERRYAGTAELAAQILEEGDNTRADVFFAQDAGALGALGKADVLAPLGVETERIPARFKAADGTWVGVSGRARVIVYNDRKVTAAAVPDSVFDLEQPQWKGRFGIAPTNASFQSFVTGMRVLVGEERTEQWLRAIQANGVQEYDENTAVLEAVDRGEIDLGLINHYYWFEKAKEVGADAMHAQVKFLGSADPGALVNVAGAAILDRSDRKDDAQRLVEFLLSAEAQAYFRDVTFEYPLADGVAAAAGLPPLAEVSGPRIELANLDSLAATLTLLDRTGLT